MFRGFNRKNNMGLKIKYYMNILGITDIENMNEDMINKCYRREATRRHPDKNGGNNESFIELSEAKDSLLDFVYAKSLKKHVSDDGFERDVENNQKDEFHSVGRCV